MEDKKVTIIMSTKNRKDIMIDAIKSVLRQTYANWELWIIDGGSEDNSIQTIQELSRRNNKIKWTTLKARTNIVCINRGLQLATGDYVCFLDSDDIIVPNKLEYQVEYLNTHPKVDVVGCTTLFNQQFGIANTINEMDHKQISELLKTTDMNEVVFPKSVMIRMTTFKKIFTGKDYLYPEFGFGKCEDALLYTLYFNKAKFANIASTIYLYRLGAMSDSMTRKLPTKYYDENIKGQTLTKKKKCILDLYNKHIITTQDNNVEK